MKPYSAIDISPTYLAYFGSLVMAKMLSNYQTAEFFKM